MEFCYVRFMETRDWDDVRDAYQYQKRDEEKKKRVDDEVVPALKEGGYSEEALDEISRIMKESSSD